MYTNTTETLAYMYTQIIYTNPTEMAGGEGGGGNRKSSKNKNNINKWCFSMLYQLFRITKKMPYKIHSNVETPVCQFTIFLFLQD